MAMYLATFLPCFICYPFSSPIHRRNQNSRVTIDIGDAKRDRVKRRQHAVAVIIIVPREIDKAARRLRARRALDFRKMRTNRSAFYVRAPNNPNDVLDL